MKSFFVRLTLSILVIVGLSMFILAYIMREMLTDNLTSTGYFYIGGGFLLTFVIVSIFIYVVIKRTLKPLEDITDVIKDLSAGHYWRRSPRAADGLLFDLSEHTNQLARYLHQATEKQRQHADRLQAIISNMPSGLLYINSKGKITIANLALMRMFQWSRTHENTIYYESPLPKEVIDHIQHVFVFEKEVKKQLTLQSNSETIHVDILVSPIKHGNKVTGLIVLLHDISDLKRLEMMRKDFVANVSHELKTPLTSIKGFSETLLDGAMYSEEHLKQFISIINKEADRLYVLIQDLLYLSDVEQKRFSLKLTNVKLNDLLNDALTLMQVKATNKNITLSFTNYTNDDAIMEGDKDRLSQIFINLISNAIQYTPNGGQVSVTLNVWPSTDHDISQFSFTGATNGLADGHEVYHTGSNPENDTIYNSECDRENDRGNDQLKNIRPTRGYRICIKDTGIGIKKSDLSRIFERFYRVDPARSRESGGTGLGLAIVKHLVEAHHGHISVDSKLGEGTSFCVSFNRRVIESES